MMQYRIVAEPDNCCGTRYKIQSKGCGPFSFFWSDEKIVVSFQAMITRTVWHSTLKQAEKEVQKLRHRWNTKSRVVKTYECGCK